MGAAAAESGIPERLITGLHDSAAIRKEIDAFVDAVLGAAGAGAGAGAGAETPAAAAL
jgi:hypothetical protein